MSKKQLEVIEIKLKDLSHVDFESQSLKDKFEIVVKRNDQLIESTKIDTESLSLKFEI